MPLVQTFIERRVPGEATESLLQSLSAKLHGTAQVLIKDDPVQVIFHDDPPLEEQDTRVRQALDELDGGWETLVAITH